jgi:hypothetical protein
MREKKLRSFVRAIEVWRPDGDLLQRDSGAYGDHRDLEQASIDLTLKKGQGLPGAAWSTMRPEVWHELGERFVRADSATTAAIGAAVAIPFFRGSELIAIVTFLCGQRDESEGCIEVWESNGKGELEHADGYYGKLSAFEAVSRQLKFPRGVGLPGLVFQYGSPQIIDDLKKSNSFLRAAAARECGVESGIGMPIYRGGAIEHVILLLSAASTPLARAFEVWRPDEQGQLSCDQAFYAPELVAFGQARKLLRAAAQEQLAGRAYASALPFAVSSATRAYPELDLAREAGIQIAVALPIDDGQRVRAVVLLFT